MNALPEHRRALAGRTYSQSWSAASMDPISHYPRPRTISTTERIAGGILATVIGVLLAAALLHWWLS